MDNHCLRRLGRCGYFVLVFSTAVPVMGQSAYFSLEGDINSVGDQYDLRFDLTRSVGSAEDLRFVTYTDQGGTNAAGDTIATSAFDSDLRLFDSLVGLRGQDNMSGPGNDALLSWPSIQSSGTPLNPDPLLGDSYRLNVSEFGNNKNGPWAVDLIGPADAIKLTDATPVATGTLNSLKFGTTGGGTALFELNASTLVIANELFVGNTGDGTLNIHSSGSMSNSQGNIGQASGSTGLAVVTGTGSEWNNSSFLIVGGSGNGTLRVEAGGLVSNTTNSQIGQGAASIGVVTVTDSNSTWTNTGNLFVGASGHGTLNVQAGGTASNTLGFIGNGSTATGVATVTGTGSTWTNSSNLTVGNEGNGTLNVQAGGSVSNDFAFIGNNFNSTGVVTVNGTDSTWTNTVGMRVGNLGDGTLNVQAGGTVTTPNGSIGGDGITAGFGTGIANVTGSGSTWTLSAGDLSVGISGNGTLNVEDGGAVSSNFGFIGFASGSSGTATVTGPGSTWVNSTNLTVGESGSGTLDVTAGGVVSNTRGRIGTNQTSIGVVTVAGSGSTWTNSTTLGVGLSGDGTLNIEDGGSVSSTTGFIGGPGVERPLASGMVTVTGPGSTWTNTGDFFVGFGGDATLIIEAGGTVSNVTGSIGHLRAFPVSVTVTGTGSTWTNTGDLFVGKNSAATLDVLDGGVVNSVNSVIAETLMFGSSVATVNGAGSLWDSSGMLTIGGALGTGSGTLNVQAGGTVTSDDGSIGSGPGSIGVVTVTGAGSSWTSANSPAIGDAGSGTMNVEAGGAVTTPGGTIGELAGSVGTVAVNGSGSTWTNTSSVHVGGSDVAAGGTGSLTVSNGGHVGVLGTLKVWDNSTLTLDGGSIVTSMLEKSGSGTFDFIAGSLTINTDITIGNDPNGVFAGSFNLNADRSLATKANTTISASRSLTLNGGSLTTKGLVVDGALVFDRGTLEITNGPITGLTSLTVPTNGEFRVKGVHNLTMLGAVGSTITATGNLTLGDPAAVNGFGSGGALHVQANTVTLEDANDVVFDSLALVTLGDGGAAGTLLMANGTTLDFGGNVTGFGTVDTPNDPTRPLINNGHITGKSPAEPITLTGYVKGVGTLDNVIITGTDAPGFSPATVQRGSVVYNGTLEIELGGTSIGDFDRIEHSGTAMLGGTLDVSLINGYTPTLGDNFGFLFANGGFGGTFDTLNLPDISGLGLDWLLNPGGSTLFLQVISAALTGDLDGDGFVGITDLNLVLGSWNQNVPPANPLADPSGDGFIGIEDLNVVLGNWNAGTPPPPAEASGTVPEPGTLGMLLVLRFILLPGRRRRAERACLA